MLKVDIPYSLIPFACSKWEYLPQFKPKEHDPQNRVNHGVHFSRVGSGGLTIGMEFPCFAYSPAEGKHLSIGGALDIAEQVFGPIRTAAFDHPEANWKDIEPVYQDLIGRVNARCDKCDLKMTQEARQFQELYYEMAIQLSCDEMGPKLHGLNGPEFLKAPYPMPEAWLATELESGWGDLPAPRVDFAFWTGTRVIAIEIVGGSHVGNTSDVKRDRMLKLKGIELIYFTNDEIERMKWDTLPNHLPNDLVVLCETVRRVS